MRKCVIIEPKNVDQPENNRFADRVEPNNWKRFLDEPVGRVQKTFPIVGETRFRKPIWRIDHDFRSSHRILLDRNQRLLILVIFS